MENVKCVVVGDGHVGKACLLKTYSTRMFPQEDITTVFDSCTKTVTVDGRTVKLEIWVNLHFQLLNFELISYE